MEPRITLITLGVADVARSRAFYGALGFEEPGEQRPEVAFLPAGGLILALWSRESLAEDSTVPDSGGWGGVTLAHNVRSPAEVDAVLEEAERAGGTVGRPGAETFWGGYSGVFI